MSPKELKNSLFTTIIKEDGAKSTEILQEYKNAGGTQLMAYRVLDEIRAEIISQGLGEKYRDLTFDIMDTVCGDVSLSSRIWEGHLSNKDIENPDKGS
jgi:hypothetical protein